jgi:putative transposase
MTRPLRIEFHGAVYHVTARGDRQEMIFTDERDRYRLLEIIAQTMRRLDAEVLSFCFMGNHYHLVLRTRQANLSRVMRHINGEYTRAFNRRHGIVGHLFQGRFKAIIVDSDAYLMEVCRYVELNPVRAGLVRTAADWPWSSYRSHAGLALVPVWLATGSVYGHLLGRDAATDADLARAASLYAQLVADGLGADLWATSLREEIFLGDDRFISRMRSIAESTRIHCDEIPKAQRVGQPSLMQWQSPGRSLQEAIWLAYRAGGMTMSAIALDAQTSLSSVSRMIARVESAARRQT